MHRYIALLRGINVGGHRKIKMAKLRSLFEDWGYHNIETYIQSGNIAFDTDQENPKQLSATVKQHILDTLEFDVPVIIRDEAQLQDVITHNPFPDVELSKTTKLYVTFLSEVPDQEKAESLLSHQNDAEKFHLTGKELYVLIHKDKVVKSVFSNAFVERKLKVSATNRNWRTVNKIYDMVKG
ncbi:MAG: DUF1697 domain-containing protein [Balneolaceae bacterium]|nr:DUF1697 domain-containing protein [Balneolaceae bacterium]